MDGQVCLMKGRNEGDSGYGFFDNALQDCVLLRSLRLVDCMCTTNLLLQELYMESYEDSLET